MPFGKAVEASSECANWREVSARRILSSLLRWLDGRLRRRETSFLGKYWLGVRRIFSYQASVARALERALRIDNPRHGVRARNPIRAWQYACGQ